MAVSRYGKRGIIINDDESYRERLKEAGQKFIRHYRSPSMSYPTPSEMNNLGAVRRVWRTGDRYFKIAHKYYGDSRLWWVIAWYNQKPTDAHVELGDIIYIPQPLDKVLSLLGT